MSEGIFVTKSKQNEQVDFRIGGGDVKGDNSRGIDFPLIVENISENRITNKNRSHCFSNYELMKIDLCSCIKLNIPSCFFSFGFKSLYVVWM